MSNDISDGKQEGATNMELGTSNRQRKQPGIPRDYKCPCGKTYLSYPALFTHIKQKHGGQVHSKKIQAPGEIVKPQTNSHARRGRPRLPTNQTTSRLPEVLAPTRALDQPAKVVQDLSEFLKQVQKTDVELKQFYEGTDLHNLYMQRVAADDNYLDPYSNAFAMPAERALSELLFEFSTNAQTTVFIPQLECLMELMIEMLHSSGAADGANHVSSLRLIRIANDFILQFQDRLGPTLGHIPFFSIPVLIKVVEMLFLWLHKKRYSESWVKINQSFLEEAT